MKRASIFLTMYAGCAVCGCSSESQPLTSSEVAGAYGTSDAGRAGAATSTSGASSGAGAAAAMSPQAGGAGGGSAGSGAGGLGSAGLGMGGQAGVAGLAGGGGSAVAGTGGAAGGVAVTDPGTDGDGPVEVGRDYPDGPVPDLSDRGKPRGRSFRFEMDSAKSKFYRGDDSTLKQDYSGFKRRIDVNVPAAFKTGAPAPFLIIHDGPAQIGLVSRALDNLTGATDPARRLPAFVAIAVANGGGDSKGSERGLEYDTMSDRFARFINEEVLPAVEANPEITTAYPGFKLMTDPEGRATMGCSSGGAAALTMGWFRPDLFRRIITYSGTFVDQQDDDAAEEKTYPLGAWEYHSGLKLIENAEKKPLRIFLHHSDGDNGAGTPATGYHNWVIANDRTADALKAKGYHYRHLTALNAGHCSGKVFDATLADTLVWAWRGFPTN